MSLAALPAPVVHLVAHLGLAALLAAAGVAALTFLAAAGSVLPWTRPREDLGGRRTGLVVTAGLVFLCVFVASHSLRGLARDVSEDRHEAAALLPVGSRVAPDGPARAAVVWAVGDGPDGGSAGRAVGRLVTADDPDRIFFLGDVYGTYTGLARGMFGADTGRVSPTPGNHDWPKSAAEYLDFWRRAEGSASQYYTFRIAGWQVLSLNSEVAHGPRSAQVRWLRREVAAPGDCRIAFFHRPRFSAGRHGDQPDLAPIWRLLVGRAALVLNGHDHDMQRLSPVDGTTEMVVGSGGHGHYALHDDPAVRFGDDRHYGALRLRLSRGSADYEFVASDGRVLDQGQVSCATGG